MQHFSASEQLALFSSKRFRLPLHEYHHDYWQFAIGVKCPITYARWWNHVFRISLRQIPTNLSLEFLSMVFINFACFCILIICQRELSRVKSTSWGLKEQLDKYEVLVLWNLFFKCLEVFFFKASFYFKRVLSIWHLPPKGHFIWSVLFYWLKSVAMSNISLFLLLQKLQSLNLLHYLYCSVFAISANCTLY